MEIEAAPPVFLFSTANTMTLGPLGLRKIG
jgi:hypothetical protein